MSISNPLSLDTKILFVSVSFLSGILLINLVIPVLPVSGLTFVFIASFTWFISLCATFVGLHKLLQHNEPISNTVFSKYLEYIGLSYDVSPKTRVTLKAKPDSIKRLTFDIDNNFISKWFSCISSNPDFTCESKVFLEEALTRLVDVVLQGKNTCVLHGLLNVYLKHMKEFRRSLKRKEKYNVGIEELYRYSHLCSTSANTKTKEYYVHRLTTSLLQHFINSELWNSLPCHILVSILARKLIYYLLSVLSTPEVLNYMILNSLATDEVKEKLNLGQYGRISIVEFFDVVDTKQNETSQESKVAMGNENDKLIETKEDKMEKKMKELETQVQEATKQQKLMEVVKAVEEKPQKDTVIMRRRRRPQLHVDELNPVEKFSRKTGAVRIYESKDTVRTWRDSRDLACISLGQDPLDMLMTGAPDSGGKVGSKPGFWETPPKSDDPKNESPPSAAHLFNEVMQMTSMEGLKTSIKPLSDATERTLHNIKDLQEATVHNALHKIGDFQVTDKQQIEPPLNYLHYLPPNTLLHSSVLSNTQRILRARPEDEAAGMVGGILDFGRAGFRKGLRLTGLQDNIETAKTAISNNSTTARAVSKSMREQVKKKLEELKRIDSESQDKMSSVESADSVWINPLQIDSPSYDGQILLEKAPTKPNGEHNPIPRIEDFPIPSISTEDASISDSPDPEYEDTADLASSIAKLRCLLQQRSSESSLSTPALSPMPDEYMQKQAESGNASDVEALEAEVDGVMPSFYKFCTKTASGVFSNTLNTLKTALPGNSTENLYTVELWKFIADHKESDTLVRMKKLLSERKEYCILDKEIDNAYDALDSVDVFQQSPVLISNLNFEDDLDDFEGKIPVTKVMVDILCELLAETNCSIIQEPIIKAVLLVLGPTIERKATSLMDDVLEFLAENLFRIPETSNTNVLSMDVDDYIRTIESCSPDVLKYFIGQDNFRSALKLFISSIQKPKINQDVLLQGFELIAMKLIQESTQVSSPPASA